MKCPVCCRTHGDYEYVEFSHSKGCDVYKCALCNGYKYVPGKKVEEPKKPASKKKVEGA